MYNLYKKMGLIKNFRLRRPQGMGHVLRMKDERAPRKAMKRYIEGRRPIGRPRKTRIS